MGKVMKRVVVLALCFFLVMITKANSKDKVRGYIVEKDLIGLVLYYNSNPDSKNEIEDAIDGYLNWDEYTYEQVRTAYESCQISDSFLKKELERVTIDKECELYQFFSTITPEQLLVWSQLYPKRKDLIENFLTNILYKGLGQQTYVELMSLESGLTGLEVSELKKALQERKDEKASLVKEKIDDYAKFEMSYKNRLLFVLRYRSWQYFIVRYKNVANIYSQIGIVPGDPGQMASQYNNIVQTCFTKEDFKKQLKKDIDAYNNAINSARSEYANMAGIKDYVKSDITIPNIGSFSIKPNLSIAKKISNARNNYESSRGTAKTVAGIASFFVSSTISNIGRGLYDLSAVSDLANAEMQIRREYMRNVYNQLHKVFESYYRTIDKEISSQIQTNNLKFKNYVKSQK